MGILDFKGYNVCPCSKQSISLCECRNVMPCLQGQSPASAGKDPGRFHRLEECEKAGLESGPREWCEELHTCHSCTAHQGCRWESEKVGKCRQSAKSAAQVAPSAGGSVDEEPGESTIYESSFCLWGLTRVFDHYKCLSIGPK